MTHEQVIAVIEDVRDNDSIRDTPVWNAILDYIKQLDKDKATIDLRLAQANSEITQRIERENEAYAEYVKWQNACDYTNADRSRRTLHQIATILSKSIRSAPR